MNGSPLHLALREMRAVFTSRYSLLGMVAAIFLLTVSGPFGTFERFSIAERLGYWTAMVLTSFTVGQGAATFFIAILGRAISQRWPLVIVAGLLTSIPVTVVVTAVDGIAFGRLELAMLLTLWFYVALITLVIVIAIVSVTDRLNAAQVTDPPPQPSVEIRAPILDRVPLPQRGKLLALSVEDHYVDIITDRGKALVLMRLADAIREAGPVPGLQVHRSHWVALDAVARTRRADGKVMLELRNGTQLPVSRGFLPAARAAGLTV